ncbi:MAG TPA: DUF2332 domain-containing protein [Actinocrinis sp.]|nr:DUF2332 domain-containing protein [Actinocrinis sp.]
MTALPSTPSAQPPSTRPDPDGPAAQTGPGASAEAAGPGPAGSAADEQTSRRFQIFLDREVAASSPLYAALTAHAARDIDQDGLILAMMAAAPERQRIPNLFFASVQRVLFDHPDEPLGAYYRSVGGDRAPDADLPGVFEDFLLAHRDRIEQLLATRETQTNEVLRSAQILPALGWARACTRRPLALIEVGTSAGLLLHADRYAYSYEFDDGERLPGGSGSADGVPRLDCRVLGRATPKSLRPFVTGDLPVASRVGLDLNPLDPADPQDRAWLRALMWPEHTARRERLEAALAHAARRPVRLRRGDALRILPDAVDGVAPNAIPCVVVSNSLPHWTPDGRTAFVRLVRELGARRDLVFVVKEAHRIGFGLFTGKPDPVEASTGGIMHEVLGAAVYLGGQERLFRLGSAGMHGISLDWTPFQV